MSAEEDRSHQHYFSNGTEGEMWMSNWCYRCTNDHSFHGDGPSTNPCETQASLYLSIADPFLIGTEREVVLKSGIPLTFTEWSCINFRRCPCDNGPDDPGEPTPIPPDPNQGELFDASKLMPGVYRDVVLDAFTEVSHV